MLLSGVNCGGESDAADDSEVVARVGSTEISKRALDREEAQAKKLLAENPDTTFTLSRRALLSAMIQAEWREQEAKARGLELPHKAMSSAERRDAVFVALEASLKPTSALPVSDAEIRAYMIEHKAELAVPPRREIAVVETSERAAALRAKRALQQKSLREVIAHYGRDVPTITEDPAGFTSVFKGQVPPVLDKAIFMAPINVYTGPIKANGSWYVFSVEREVAAIEPTLENVGPAIRSRIQELKRGQLLDRFLGHLSEKYRSRTVCEEELRVVDCRNGPRPPAS